MSSNFDFFTADNITTIPNTKTQKKGQKTLKK